jgi:hypothetical protein
VRLGILSDVHGHRIAREAVLADGHTCGVDTWWALGDLVALGPDPVGAAELPLEVRPAGHPAHDYVAAMFRRGG